MLQDRLLTWQYNRGRTDVLGRIYLHYKDHLVTLAACVLMNKDLAEDVVHTVFTRLIRSFKSLKVKTSMRKYLVTCVINESKNINKSAASRVRQLTQELQISSSGKTLGTDACENEEKVRLIEALSMLPYEQRQAILLKHYSGMKFREIADITNESINNVQGRYRYGLEKLRSLLISEKER